MVKVGIAGGSGYGGLELIHLLLRHPETELAWVSSEQYAGKSPADLYPHLRGIFHLPFSRLEEVLEGDLDILFLALPHGEAMKLVPRLPAELRIIDLSGDFRISDPEVFERYYGFPMSAAELQGQFVYGLPEIYRERIREARRIANPGCFATATVLALYPLFQEGWIEGPVYVDTKTGSSGAGRTPSAGTHHPRRSQSLFPYKPFRHQHLAEILQILNRTENPLVFQTYSVPLVRGIFASHYFHLSPQGDGSKLCQLYGDYYGREPFIRWVPGCPDVSAVSRSNYVDLGAASQDGFAIVWCALDNLQKGAAGQAVQNMNLMLGVPETTALDAPPSFP